MTLTDHEKLVAIKSKAVYAAWEKLPNYEKNQTRHHCQSMMTISGIGYYEFVELAGKLGMWIREKGL